MNKEKGASEKELSRNYKEGSLNIWPIQDLNWIGKRTGVIYQFSVHRQTVTLHSIPSHDVISRYNQC